MPLFALACPVRRSINAGHYQYTALLITRASRHHADAAAAVHQPWQQGKQPGLHLQNDIEPLQDFPFVILAVKAGQGLGGDHAAAASLISQPVYSLSGQSHLCQLAPLHTRHMKSVTCTLRWTASISPTHPWCQACRCELYGCKYAEQHMQAAMLHPQVAHMFHWSNNVVGMQALRYAH